MSQTPLSLPQQRGVGQTSRKDAWWLQPLVVFLGLSAFVIYANWAAFQASYYEAGPYLSPMYSPLLWEAPTQAAIKAETPGVGADAHVSHHSWLGAWPQALQPGWVPGWMLSPALIILIFPAGFRLTCYYYRGAYYKAFWADPLNCAVGEPRNSFRGENFWPLLVQNIHRYFFYAAAIYIFILAYDAWVGLWHAPAGMNYDAAAEAGMLEFGVGIGTLVLTLNVILLGGYTFGCHSARHIFGGKHDHLSKLPTGKMPYECISCLNRNHMKWAWFSLVWVGFTDFYIRMCAMNIWTDWRLF